MDRANLEGDTLILNLGYSHPIKFPVPEGLIITVEGNKINVAGADNIVVGEAAATIRKYRKPEPYKGKGIRYEGEIVRRKAGKKAASAGSA
jgi:large subunit ribosomal protein L6